MTTLQGITDQPKQSTSIVLDDGTAATIVLEYRPQQLGWFYNLAWQDFTLNGQRIVASPNILRSYRKILPFGLAVLTNNGIEPLNQDDFINGTITLLLLNAQDVLDVETTVFTGS